MEAYVLVIEDEHPIRRMITIQLQRSGFEVKEAETGTHAMELMKDKTPDLVVLDIRLPDMDGFQVCELLYREYPDSAILILTALGQDMDKLTGLELGADDYMVKPFNPLELAARVRAILRRLHKGEPHHTSQGPFQLNEQSKQVLYNGIALDLTPTEYYLVSWFLHHPGQTFSRDQLLNEIWGEDYYGVPKSVDVHIRRLREKIEEIPAEPQWIETVWGMGYRWNEKL
ncbi:response regulator transcription factor [Salibacterium qingdaonense]|uniref:DNA-binding response regulator, OmpR family, contains REC and winged-helix (WHTH) domain n=1 Tax=Salibacterium qingdaonense TaxID=266892 RepID=A0A1I4LPB8_9BACI|nr:response regulator transcription factor [Salibacterium qingdaonense]SFL92676.1 DNA-binding response regulator, OmpR family, contains REC and winged-helix (wHTH) domain [Salibacterium qingdaonense]